MKFAGIPELDCRDEEQINEFVELICQDDWLDDNIMGKMI